MFRLLAVAAVPLSIFAVGMLLYAVLRRRSGKPIPAWTTYGGLVAFGASFGFLPIGWAYEPVFLLPRVGLPLVSAAVLALTRRYRMAGALLLGLALPSVAWWGGVIVADVLDPLVGYQLVLIGWFAQSLFVAALGVVGVVVGNRVRTDPPPSRDGPPESRVFVIMRAFNREIRLGPGTYPETIAAPAGLLVLIGASVGADRFGVPPLLAVAVGVPVAAAVATETWYRVLSRRLRHAMDGFSVLGSYEAQRWKETTSSPIPTSLAAAQGWLDAHPETPQSQWARVELLAWAGRLDEARAAIERMPDDTPQDRLDRVVASTLVSWVADGEDSITELRAAAATFGQLGADERRIADAHVAYAEAQRAEASGHDWAQPLIALRNRVEPQFRVWHRDMWWPRFRLMLLLLAGFGVALILFVQP